MANDTAKTAIITEANKYFKLSDEDLTSRAIEEIFREVHVAEIRSKEFGSSTWKACPLRKTNKRFLCSTIRSVEVHNKRHHDRIKKSCDNKLEEIIQKSSSYDRNDKDHHRTKYRRCSGDDDNTHGKYNSADRPHYKNKVKHRSPSIVEETVSSYEQPSYELQPHPAHLMYYYNSHPPPIVVPSIIEVSQIEKQTKKPSKNATRKSKKHKRKKEEKAKTKKKSKKSIKKTKSKKTKDNLFEFVKRKLKENKGSKTEDADDCFEVVDLTV